jgi:uncharacterized protein (TIGR02145 family)
MMMFKQGRTGFTLILLSACTSENIITEQENSTPTFATVASISPSTGVRTNTALVCTASATDLEDGVVTLNYEWTVGSAWVATGDAYTVSASDTNVGDSIVCTATAIDSDNETATSTANVLLENTEPVLSQVSISPDSGVLNDSVLSCTGSVTDPDEQGLSPSYDWMISGVQVGTGTELDLYTTAALPMDSVECLVSVTDSQGASDSDIAMVSIDNRIPTSPTVLITPASPMFAVDDLVCSASGSIDADGQAVSYSYSWVSDLGAAVNGDTVLSSMTVAEELWTCTAVASDGMDSSDASASVVIGSECGDPLTDIDGNTYSTVEIGTQCWMGSNLNTTNDANGGAVSRWCCDCNQYGGMYDWSTVMNGSSADGAQGICPKGWHVPSDADWFALESYIDPSMTDPNYIGWNTTTIGDDLYLGGSYGFDWTTGGFSSNGNGCNYNYDRIGYWTSSNSSSTEAISRFFNTAIAGNNRDIRGKAFGFYIRCLKD